MKTLHVHDAASCTLQDGNPLKERRFVSINRFCARNGVPIHLVRREVKRGIVPGFYSGSWYYVDEPTYLLQLSARNGKAGEDNVSA